MDPHVDVAAADDAEWDVALDVHVERQNGLRWCWAAVAKGIVEYYGGPRRRQCEYATEFLRQTRSCCGDEGSPRCDVEYPVDAVLRRHGMDAPPAFARPVSLQTLRRELERDRPVVALISYPHTFHAVVISGVSVRDARIRFNDPDDHRRCASLSAHTFATAYAEGAAWAYTLFTRPGRFRTGKRNVSFLHEPLPDGGAPRAEIPGPDRFPMKVAYYSLDVRRLAAGDGIESAQVDPYRASTLFTDDPRNDSWFERGLEALRNDVIERVDAGYTVRLVQCMNVLLTALWFVWAGDPARRRGDHYLIIPPAPYYLEEGREYTAAELSDAVRKPANIALRSLPVFEEMKARLEREAVDPPEM